MTPLPDDPALKAKLHKLFDEVMRSTHLTEGRMVKLLEDRVKVETGMEAVAVNSCGSGLFALYRVFGHKNAVVPTNTFFATGAMAREAGYTIKLADTAPDRFSCGLQQYMEVADMKDSMIVLTHVGGKAADEYASIAKWVKESGRILIEDAAHAFGVPGIGLLGDAAVFSLYPTKAIPVGEGGIIVTKHKELAADLRVFRNYGKEIGDDGVIRYSPGFNLRMDEWTAAVAIAQIDRMSDIIERRQVCAEQLMGVVRCHPEFELAWSNWYKFPVRAENAINFTKRTGPIYQVSDQLTTAMFSDRPPLPNAADIANGHVCLPIGEGLYDGMSSQQIADWLGGS